MMRPSILRCAVCLMLAGTASSASPALAQQAGEAQEAGETPQGPTIIDLTLPQGTEEPDPLLEAICDEDAEAGIVAGEIVVCRTRGSTSDGAYDHQSFLSRYAEATQGAKTPDFILDCHDQGWPFGCIRMGSAPPPALIIDVEALPQAPPGSDADRIARGLAPLGAGSQPDLFPDEELGLPPPPTPTQPAPSPAAPGE